jgi:hypothetical protein
MVGHFACFCFPSVFHEPLFFHIKGSELVTVPTGGYDRLTIYLFQLPLWYFKGYINDWRHCIDISPFLTSIELGRLSMIGCKLLFDKFTSGLSSFIHRPRLQRHYSLPCLFFSFPNLLHLDITLPSSLLKLKIRVEVGKIDLLSQPTFIDSLNYLPPGIISFKLDHPLYRTSRSSKYTYRDSEGKFCFPECILDLARTHPRLACIEICNYELGLSRIDCKTQSE